jgi:ABC-type branched-subunit amino acid transport system ATPase component
VVGLHKVFGEYAAVRHVDLTVRPGSFYGLVGPNGAGKTTTLSTAVGLLRPDAGRSLAFGTDVWKDPQRAKALMGVLPNGLAMPEQLTGRERGWRGRSSAARPPATWRRAAGPRRRCPTRSCAAGGGTRSGCRASSSRPPSR